MNEEALRAFFADARMILHINLGSFCDRNKIYRSDFTNFMKGKKYWTSNADLEAMKRDIIDHCSGFIRIYG